MARKGRRGTRRKESGRPDSCAVLVAENIAAQLERRISFRRAMKQTVARALRAGAKGVKVQCGGRLGGSDIARSERYKVGRVPLQTLRANIQYGFAEAMTLFGKIGVKVWVYHGEILPVIKEVKEKKESASDTSQVKV